MAPSGSRGSSQSFRGQREAGPISSARDQIACAAPIHRPRERRGHVNGCWPGLGLNSGRDRLPVETSRATTPIPVTAWPASDPAGWTAVGGDPSQPGPPSGNPQLRRHTGVERHLQPDGEPSWSTANKRAEPAGRGRRQGRSSSGGPRTSTGSPRRRGARPFTRRARHLQWSAACTGRGWSTLYPEKLRRAVPPGWYALCGNQRGATPMFRPGSWRSPTRWQGHPAARPDQPALYCTGWRPSQLPGHRERCGPGNTTVSFRQGGRSHTVHGFGALAGYKPGGRPGHRGEWPVLRPGARSPGGPFKMAQTGGLIASEWSLESFIRHYAVGAYSQFLSLRYVCRTPDGLGGRKDLMVTFHRRSFYVIRLGLSPEAADPAAGDSRPGPGETWPFGAAHTRSENFMCEPSPHEPDLPASPPRRAVPC